MASALFCDITRPRVVIPYRRFGTTSRSNHQESSSFRGLWRWDWKVVPKRSYGITTVHCVMSQKIADLMYIAAEAWNHVQKVNV